MKPDFWHTLMKNSSSCRPTVTSSAPYQSAICLLGDWNVPAICLLGDWNVLTKPVRANQQKLVKIEEESTIGQLLKLWAKVKIPNFCKKKNIALT